MSPTPAKINPFPGLRPFTQQEDYLFFGREEQTIELLQRLGSNRFVAVVGTSGSGKSSLVRCGLLSELLGGRMLEAGASWEVAVTHPGGNPLALLTEAFLDADLYDRAIENTRENLLATLSRSHFGLVEAVKQAGLGEGTNFLLIVDQFEEIFRFHEAGQTQQEMANEFVSLLLEAAAQTEAPIFIVLTMRSDFIGDCGQFEGLAERVNRGEFLIPRLTREQYKRVIEGPVKVAGGQIAPRLLQRLLNDLGQQADQLPCLQHALMRTWNVRADRGDAGALDLEDYQRVGKMTQALSLHADEIYDRLATDRQRHLCKGLFQALTVQESENRGIRRPQRLGRLCQILDVPADDLLPIIEAYRGHGVTFLMPAQDVELTDRTVIDLSHESLMRVWARLRHWVDEEAQAAGIYLRLSESAALFGQGKTGLYRDPELGIALAWQESQRPNAAWAERYRPGFDAAMAFLKSSQEASVAEEQAREAGRQRELDQARELAEAQQLRLDQQQRAARKLRKVIAGLAVVALIAGLACVAALIANKRANTLADIARQNEDNARQSQHETASALSVVESQKAVVEGSLSKAETAERLARAAVEEGRQLQYTTDLQLAPFVWKDDRSTAEQMRILLAKHIPDSNAAAAKPDLRGFEWRYYQHLLNHNAAVFSGHDVAVVGGAFASDGQFVTLDQNGQIRHWDADAQHEDEANRRDLPGGPSARVRVLSLDGRLAALAEGNKVHVFDVSTGKETFSIDSANGRYRRMVFSRDGDKLVIVDDKIRWLSTVNGEAIASLDQKIDHFNNLSLSADGLTLGVVGTGYLMQKFSVFRLDPATKTVIQVASEAGGYASKLISAMSPDGKQIGVSYMGGDMAIFDTITGNPIVHLSAHPAAITAMSFSDDGAKLATADEQGTIKIWAQPQTLVLRTLKGHRGAITTLCFSIDGKRLMSTSADKTARVWDLNNPDPAIRPLERFRGSINEMVRFSPDGLLIAGHDGSGGVGGKSVFLWDAGTGRLVRELQAADRSSAEIFSVAFSPADSRLLAVGCAHDAVSYVSLWDIDAGIELARLPAATDLPGFKVDDFTGAACALAFSPDGKYLVAGFGVKHITTRKRSPNPLKVWEVATRRPILVLNGHSGYCTALDFSRDGSLLASSSRDGTAIVWSTETWKALRTLENPDRGTEEFDDLEDNNEVKPKFVECVAFSPDGKILAMASSGGSVLLWDVATGMMLESLKGHASRVRTLAFSLDGRTLASGGEDRTVHLWNVQTGRDLMQLDPGAIALGSVQAMAFSPDGKRLLAAGGNAAVWSTEPAVLNDSDRVAEQLWRLLQSSTEFQIRIRMLSENPRMQGTLEKLGKLAPNDSRVQAALAAARARSLAAQGDAPSADAARAKARALFEEMLAKQPDNYALAAELTQLLQDDHDKDRVAQWMVLRPVEAKSKLGATLSILPDDSILASGANPSKDSYHVVLTVGKNIDLAAVRLELLTHPSLPGNGPGRQAAGTCALNSWKVTANSPDRKDPMTLEFKDAWADHELAGYPIRPDGHWNIYGGQGGNCTAIWSTSNRVSLAAGATLTFDLQCQQYNDAGENLGRFRLSATGDPAAIDRQRFAISKLADPWERLAIAYQLLGDQKALNILLKHHPAAAIGVAQLYAAAQDWEQAIAELRKVAANQPFDRALSTKLATAYESAGRTREAVGHLALASAADPGDTALFLKVAALQAWFGEEREFAATRRGILASAKDTSNSVTAERAARACCILPSTDKAELDVALALGRTAVKLDNARAWNLLALGMAEYRAGNYAAADQALLGAAKSGHTIAWVTGISTFYRAMSLSRQGKEEEAHKLATAAKAKTKPLPKDENNPLAGNGNYDDLILWLAYKEAKTLIKFDAAPAAPTTPDGK
jgi:WD40 repeat protein